jgi:hypothetical protein
MTPALQRREALRNHWRDTRPLHSSTPEQCSRRATDRTIRQASALSSRRGDLTGTQWSSQCCNLDSASQRHRLRSRLRWPRLPMPKATEEEAAVVAEAEAAAPRRCAARPRRRCARHRHRWHDRRRRQCALRRQCRKCARVRRDRGTSRRRGNSRPHRVRCHRVRPRQAIGRRRALPDRVMEARGATCAGASAHDLEWRAIRGRRAAARRSAAIYVSSPAASQS